MLPTTFHKAIPLWQIVLCMSFYGALIALTIAIVNPVVYAMILCCVIAYGAYDYFQDAKQQQETFYHLDHDGLWTIESPYQESQATLFHIDTLTPWYLSLRLQFLGSRKQQHVCFFVWHLSATRYNDLVRILRLHTSSES